MFERKNICKSAFGKYSFADVGDLAENPGPSCNLRYSCVVLGRGRAKRPRKEGNGYRWWEIEPQRISLISGPTKQVIFESINSRFVVNLLSCARFHVQQLINAMFVGSKRLYELYKFKSAQQDADDRDEELGPEESLGKTNSVLKILMKKVGQECGIPSVIINHRL